MTEGDIHSVDITQETAGLRLDRALAIAIPTISREQIQRLISTGAVLQTGPQLSAARPARDRKAKVRDGERFSVAIPAPVEASAQAQDIPVRIVFEDEHLLVVDKPAGLVVHPAAGNHDSTLVNALLHHCRGRLSGIGGVARPGIVHRIDKDTSGLLVVAKTDPAHVGLARQFAAHTVRREYFAVANGFIKEAGGTIDAPLARSPHNRKKVAIVHGDHAKRAVTHWTREALLGSDATVVTCRLETGRTHQVRVHMASIGHPLVGDPLYGHARRQVKLNEVMQRISFDRQALHARQLGFRHPATGEQIDFESPVPEDMTRLISLLTGSF